MTDRRLEDIIGKLLLTGVGLSAAIVLIGGACYMAGGGPVPDYHVFQPRAQSVAAVRTLPWPEAIIELGLLLLIATPIARVVFALAGFALERDRLYVGFTAVVLAVLLYSIGTAWW